MMLVELNKLHAEGRLLGRCALIKATHHSAEDGVEGGVIISWDNVGELGIAIHGRLDDTYWVEYLDVAAVVDGPWQLDDRLLTADGAENLHFVLATSGPAIQLEPRAKAALESFREAA